MRIALYGPSALAALLTVHSPHAASSPMNAIMHDALPTAQAIEYARHHLPQLPLTLHLLTPRWERVVGESVILHRAAAGLSPNSLLKIGDGLYAASPELCLIQLARTATYQEVIFYGSLLCGTFSIDPTAPTGLRKREPLSTASSIRRFVQNNPGLNGVATLRRCLPYITEHAASPPEAFLRMVLALPHRLGGFGLKGAAVNQRLRLGRRARDLAGRATLIPDLCWPDRRLDVEYDADSVHLTSHQALLDTTKRLALEAEGFKVISVTSLQLGSKEQMRNVAREVSRRIGHRIRIRSQSFHEAQHQLFSLEWSLRPFFNADWLTRDKMDLPQNS